MERIKELLRFQGHTISRKGSRDIIDERGRILEKHESNQGLKMWIAKDHSIAYEHNSEANNYLFQRLSYRDTDGLYHTYTVSMHGLGNIPWKSTLSAHEVLKKCPYVLKENKGISTRRTEDDDFVFPSQKFMTYIYPAPRYIDKLGRATVVTVLSRDMKLNDQGGKDVFLNAFDLRIQYMGAFCKPKKMTMMPPNSGLVAQVLGVTSCGSEVTDLTRTVFAKLGINTDEIIRPARMMPRVKQGESR